MKPEAGTMPITPHHAAHAEGEPPGVLRAMALGSVVGVVTTLVAVTGILLIAAQPLAVALGIGGMSAFWGGLGFGSMVGGVVRSSRHE